MRTVGGLRIKALAFALAAVCLAGCPRRKSGGGYVGEPEIFATAKFPGPLGGDMDVGDDGKAASPAGLDVDDFRALFNGPRGTAMIVYDELEGSTIPKNEKALYVQYFDGTLHPAVRLSAAVSLSHAGDNLGVPGATHSPTVRDVTVAWVNASAGAVAEDRDGDAIICWRGSNFAPGGGESNVGLYATYFDVTSAGDPAKNYGFQAAATRLDVLSLPAERVTTHGFLSDGLCGEARWEPFGNRYAWGDETTEIVVFWNQLQDTGAGLDSVTWWARFPLDQAGPPEDPLVPTAPAKVAVLGFGASDTGVLGGETMVDTRYVSYGKTLWQRVAARKGAAPALVDFAAVPAGEDITIQAATFDSATPAFYPPVCLQTTLPSALDSTENGADFVAQAGDFLGGHGVYGPDEGLVELDFVSTELGAKADGSYVTDPKNSGRLVLSRINPVDGTAGGAAFLDAEQPGIVDPVNPREVDLAISRNGDYVAVAWREAHDNGAFPFLGLWGTVITTSRDPDAGIRPIAEAVPPAPAELALDLAGTSVSWFQFQDHLGYICGRQSDAAVFNLCFEQDDGTRTEVDRVRVSVDLSTAPAGMAFDTTVLHADPAAGILSGSAVVADRRKFNFTDAGNAGEVFAVFFESTGALPADKGLFAIRTGTSEAELEIDSCDPGLSPKSFVLVSTPAGDAIGVLGGDNEDQRDHGAELVHVVFSESEFAPGIGLGLEALRTRCWAAGDPGPDSFSSRFTPDPAVARPFQISADSTDTTVPASPRVFGLTQAGNAAAVYFSQFGHLFYQEYAPPDDAATIGWRVTATDPPLTDPAIIDETAPEPVVDQQLFVHACTCDTLHGALTLWLKVLGGSSAKRLQGRVRDAD